MTATCDVVIIGAGPAGLAAADVLAGRNLDVRLLDENPGVGGQWLRMPAPGNVFKRRLAVDAARRRGMRLTAAARNGIRVETGVQVLGIFPPDRLLVQQSDGRVKEMAARCMICASGARERFIPFPGWTLPGVFATGAAQILLKSAAMLPAADNVVAGTGPLPLLLARQILAHGGRVVGVFDGASMAAKLQMLRLLPRQAGRLVHGAWLMAGLAAAGVPLRSNRWVVAAGGRRRLASITTGRLDRTGAVVPGSARTLDADGLAVGFGFVPNIELLQQAGCDVAYSRRCGGWVACTDSHLQTSIPNLFAAGEVTGIGGGPKSLVEGRLCGLGVIDRLGIKAPGSGPLMRRLCAKRDAEMVFARMLGRISRVPPQVVAAIPDETIVCRCEDVRMADVRRALADGFATPGALKKATRCGMGNCQGRVCAAITADVLDVLAGEGRGSEQPPSVRAPVKMVSLGALAKMQRLNDPSHRNAM